MNLFEILFLTAMFGSMLGVVLGLVGILIYEKYWG